MLPVDFFAIADLEDKDDQFFVVDRVDDSIVAFADAVEVVLAGEFLHALRTRIVLQGLHAFDEALLNSRREGMELAFRRRGEEDRIGHQKLRFEILQNGVE